MIKLTGTQRELMEIFWENGEMTLHALTRAAIGNAVTPSKIETVRVILLQMVTKGAVEEDASVSPHVYKPIATRDDVGFESGFMQAAQNEGNAILTALSCGMPIQGVYGDNGGTKAEQTNSVGPTHVVTDEERKAAIKEAMAQICRERDEYEAQKAAAKKAEEDAE